MATIYADSYSGASRVHVTADQGEESLSNDIRGVAADLAELRSKFIDVLQKLDVDAAATGGSNNYESLLTPAALETIAG